MKKQPDTLTLELQKKADVFNTLNDIDASKYVEEKNGLKYLSWAWAWGIVKRLYPESFYTIYENAQGWNYFTDGKTCWVKTGVTIVDGEWSLEHVEYLPIMNHRNASIPLEDIKSFDVNKAIQRSLTKAIARHGLGLYIYAGEDLPEVETARREEQAAAERALAEQLGTIIVKIDNEVRKRTVSMDKEAKIKFCNDVIIPVIGVANYKTCKDEAKLTELLSTLTAA